MVISVGLIASCSDLEIVDPPLIRFESAELTIVNGVGEYVDQVQVGSHYQGRLQFLANGRGDLKPFFDGDGSFSYQVSGPDSDLTLSALFSHVGQHTIRYYWVKIEGDCIIQASFPVVIRINVIDRPQ